MRADLSRLSMLAGKRWRLAADGDAAAAIGIVLQLRKIGAAEPVIDLAMTALAATAACGNAAACAVLASALRSSGIPSDGPVLHAAGLARASTQRSPDNDAEDVS